MIFLTVFLVALTIVLPLGMSYVHLRIKDHFDDNERKGRKIRVIKKVVDCVSMYTNIGKMDV